MATLSLDDSILLTVRKLVGGEENSDHFDKDLLSEINAAVETLTQIGLADKNFFVADDSATWRDLVGEYDCIKSVYSYVTLSVRLYFDPPTNGTVLQQMKDRLNELEWRIRDAIEIG